MSTHNTTRWIARRYSLILDGVLPSAADRIVEEEQVAAYRAERLTMSALQPAEANKKPGQTAESPAPIALVKKGRDSISIKARIIEYATEVCTSWTGAGSPTKSGQIAPKVAKRLADEGIKTNRGKPYSAESVVRLLSGWQPP